MYEEGGLLFALFYYHGFYTENGWLRRKVLL